MHNGLSTAENVNKMGISVRNCCYCCPSYSNTCESSHHLFFESEAANYIWNHFFNMFGIDRDKFNAWNFFVTRNNSMSFMFIRSVAYSVMWELWFFRNKTKFTQVKTNLGYLFVKLKIWVKDLCSLLYGKSCYNNYEKNFMSALGIKYLTSKSLTCLVICWSPPAMPYAKLNVDGASKGNPGHSGGGGVIRSSTGKILFAFHNYYGINTSLFAETKALLDGLKFCNRMGLSQVEVETDSMVLLKMVKNRKCTKWNLKKPWSELMALLHLLIKIEHIYREGNQIADLLANEAVQSKKAKEYHSEEEFPVKMKSMAKLEAMRVPYIRVVRR